MRSQPRFATRSAMASRVRLDIHGVTRWERLIRAPLLIEPDTISSSVRQSSLRYAASVDRGYGLELSQVEQSRLWTLSQEDGPLARSFIFIVDRRSTDKQCHPGKDQLPLHRRYDSRRSVYPVLLGDNLRQSRISVSCFASRTVRACGQSQVQSFLHQRADRFRQHSPEQFLRPRIFRYRYAGHEVLQHG